MMTKKDFKELANMCAEIEPDFSREDITDKMICFCLHNNSRFNERRFREWIRRVREGESTKGLG